MKMSLWMVSVSLLLALMLAGCNKEMDEDIKTLNEYVTKDVSEFEIVDAKKFDGTISVYCAKPAEWFVIEKDNLKYCFVITDKTSILDNKGKKQKHQMFNVGTNDIVEIKVKAQCGSLSEDYNDASAWFVCDSIKVLDTLEY